jgi:hypothetical protein
MGYSLPVSHLSFEQLNKLQQPIVPVVLSMMGFCSNTSRMLTFLCSFYGGLDFRNFRLEQGIGQITFIFRHLHTPGQVHDLLNITISWAQYCAGVGYPIFLYPDRLLPHLDGHWLVNIREFLATIDGSLKLIHTHIPPLSRTGDLFLMEKACDSGRFSPAHLRKLNYCRLYLNVTTLSDVCNTAGTRFAVGILEGIRSIQQSSSKGPSAKQELPSNPTWAIWRRLLHLIGDKHLLHQTLGPWHMTGPTISRDWPFLYSREYRRLYHLTNRHYNVSPYSCHGIFSFAPEDRLSKVPADYIPVDATEASDGWRVIYPNPSLYPQETVTFMLTFGDYVATLPDYDVMLIQRVDFCGLDVYETHAALLASPTLLLVSDGGADNCMGSAGWIVSDADGKRLVQGSGSIPGHDPRSYRAKGYAMESGLTVLKHICLFCDHINTLLLRKIYCDNLGLIKKVTYFFKYRLASIKCVLHSEYDIVYQVFCLLREYQSTPAILHVKGHQDSKIPYANLPLPAQLNVDADVLATRELREHLNLIHHTPLFPNSKVQLLLGGSSVSRLLWATRKQ